MSDQPSPYGSQITIGRAGNQPVLAVWNWIMDDLADNTPPGWIEALNEADAEIDAGLFVSAEEVHRLFRDAKTRRKPNTETRESEATARHW